MTETAVRKKLLFRLSKVLAKEFVLATEEQLKPFECDGLSVYRELPLVAVLPGNNDEIQKVIKICWRKVFLEEMIVSPIFQIQIIKAE